MFPLAAIFVHCLAQHLAVLCCDTIPLRSKHSVLLPFLWDQTYWALTLFLWDHTWCCASIALRPIMVGSVPCLHILSVAVLLMPLACLLQMGAQQPSQTMTDCTHGEMERVATWAMPTPCVSSFPVWWRRALATSRSLRCAIVVPSTVKGASIKWDMTFITYQATLCALKLRYTLELKTPRCSLYKPRQIAESAGTHNA